ncbi:hypothetical protein [Kribbella sp. NPDC004536]|uniref:hypothetical protein n=1 Tax=Kribbella sp. NPDC004536 TaxID=3364106 RepID=UPI003684447C
MIEGVLRSRHSSHAAFMGALLMVALSLTMLYIPLHAAAHLATSSRNTGVLTVTGCSYEPTSKGYFTATCRGDFRSDSGAIAAKNVTVSFQRSSDVEITPMAGRQWRAQLRSIDDRNAELVKPQWNIWTLVFIAEAVLGAWLIAQAVWLSRRLSG